jgi:hypothetical protein
VHFGAQGGGVDWRCEYPALHTMLYCVAVWCGAEPAHPLSPNITQSTQQHPSPPSPLLLRREDKPLASTLATRHIAPSPFANTSMSRQYLHLRLRVVCGCSWVGRDAGLVVHGLRGHGSWGRCMGMEGWEARIFVNWVFIVFLGFDLAIWFPGPGRGAGL